MNILYKIHLPFDFHTSKNRFHDELTIKKFKLNHIDVEIKDQLDASGCSKMYAYVNFESDETDEDILDNLVGSTIQKFLDGITKGLNNTGFFEIYNGEYFLSDCESIVGGTRHHISPCVNTNKGYYLYDSLISKAIEFVNTKETFLNRAWYYLKEAEYFVEIGRIESAIIQLAIMSEYLINYILNHHGLLKNGELKKRFYEEAVELYKEETGKDGKPSFAFRKYYYGLNKLNYSLEKEMMDDIDFVYYVRNNLAHGEDLYNIDIIIESGINKINIHNYMSEIVDRMVKVYNYFVDNFKE